MIEHVRVTDILSPFTGYRLIDPTILQRAADRGTKVHEAIDGFIGGLGNFGLDEEAKPYFESFQQFWGEGHEILKKEERMFCDTLEITGKLDCIVVMKKQNVLVDWKTSSQENKTWRYQAAFYRYLAQVYFDVFIDTSYFIKLDKKGKAPKVFEYTDYKEDLAEALLMLKMYNKFFKVTKDSINLEFL